MHYKHAEWFINIKPKIVFSSGLTLEMLPDIIDVLLYPNNLYQYILDAYQWHRVIA